MKVSVAGGLFSDPNFGESSNVVRHSFHYERSTCVQRFQYGWLSSLMCRSRGHLTIPRKRDKLGIPSLFGIDMRLNSSQISAQLAQLPRWGRRGNRIRRTFVFDDFMQGIRFLNRVARLAEGMNHHPDISIRYNRVGLSLTTHDEGGLTIKDFSLAKKINRLTRD